jgi:hypothetical protein
MNIWYSKVNAKMHCVDVTMDIGTFVLFIGKFDCIMKILVC